MPRKSQKTGSAVPNSVPLQAETSGESLDLAAIFDRPEKVLPTATFFPATAAYTPNENVAWYLYRKWPVIDKCLVHGPKADTNIDKFHEAMAGEVDVLRKWGSGDYRLCFTDAGRPKGSQRIAETRFSLRSDDYPPVLDYAELAVEDPKNDSYVRGLRVRGLLPGQQEEEMDKGTATQLIELGRQSGAAASNQVPREAIETMREAFSSAMTLANPAKMLEMIQPFIAAQNGGGNAELMKFLLSQQQEMFKVMTESRRPNGGGDGSLTDRIEEFMKLNKLMQTMGGRGGGTDWVGGLVQAFPMIVGLISHAAAAYRGGDVPAASPALGGVPAPSAPEAAAAPAPPELRTVLLQVLNVMERKFGGDDFATSVAMQYGDEAYQQMAAMGVDALFAFFQADTEVAPRAQAAEADLRQFLADFVAYGQADGDEAAV